MMVDVMRELGVIAVFRVGELEGALTGVMQCIEGNVVPGTSTDVVGRGLGGLLGSGEGFQ